MNPWLWFWAPQIQFPLGGNLAQNIEPNTTWFSDLIKEDAGNAQIEEKAFAIASYGTQLGLITDVLLALTESASVVLTPQTELALQKLKKINSDIDALKGAEYEAQLTQLGQQIKAAIHRGGPELEMMKDRLLPLLQSPAT